MDENKEKKTENEELSENELDEVAGGKKFFESVINPMIEKVREATEKANGNAAGVNGGTNDLGVNIPKHDIAKPL